ncbi:hypothetical protein [Paraburkholderia sp. RL17-347-BIC-D]|uniref:hypothetical protein n=1 Tax=Paraburkholderia sp. RL17-347-BIC-D TaxID=3031632 RepID=UPI0038BCC967
MVLNRVQGWISLILLMAVEACGSPKLENIDLGKAWAKKLAPYNLVALFPPRSTVEPGDVYIVCSNPDDNVPADKKFESVFLMTLPGFHSAMSDFFTSRLILPESPQAASGTVAFDASETPSGITIGNKWTRLGLVSFPEVFQTEGSVTTAGGAAPTGFAIFGIGAEHKALSTYVLSMPAAEWAGLPWLTAQTTARQALDKLSNEQMRQIKAVYDRLNDKYQSACGKVRLAYVSEVYYARHLTLSYGSDKSAAIAAQARLYINSNQARYNVQQAASNTVAASAPGAASAASDANVNQVNANLAAAAAGANAAANLGLPGASLNSAYAETDGVSFDYSFAHPVAVGTRLGDLLVQSDGSTVKVSVDDGASPVPGYSNPAPMAASAALASPTTDQVK